MQERNRHGQTDVIRAAGLYLLNLILDCRRFVRNFVYLNYNFSLLIVFSYLKFD